MKSVILDTDVLIDYANGHAKWLDKAALSEEIQIKVILPTIVIAEYFASTVFDKEEDVLIADKTFALFAKQDLTESIAKVLGSILRHKTYVPGAGLADLIIASTALFFDAELATCNKKDFEKIPHLRFFDPKSVVL